MTGSVVLCVLLVVAIVNRLVRAAALTQKHEELTDKVNSLDLDKVVLDVQFYLEHLKNGSISDDRSFHSDLLMLDPSSQIPGYRYMGTGLSTMVDMLQLSKVAYEFENSFFGAASCTFCKVGFMFLKYYMDRDMSLEQAAKDAKMLCKGISVVRYQVCSGLVDMFTKEVVTVVKQSRQTPEEMCGFMFGEACDNPHNPKHEWKPFVPPNAVYISSKSSRSSVRDVLTIVHVSDTHWDPLYKEGSNAECGDPLCCREDKGDILAEDKAGYWGDFRKCDTPWRTIETMYRHIRSSHSDIDLIYWTGDLPAHDIWNQTKEGNQEVVRRTARQLRKFFPVVPVYPALGNHESVPVDSFPPPSVSAGDVSMSWLYSTLAEEWGHWLGESHAWSVKHGAYYSLNVAPGLRVISLNMNYCMNKNIWLLINSTDPADQLQWLVYELQLSEFKGEKVHILGHIPPGHVDCVKVWSENFYSIINRYSSTVTAQFYGHTHRDEFQVFYSASHRPVNVAYIAPSVTPYYGLNPSYRVYEVSFTGEVMDCNTWIMDLARANRYPSKEPEWQLHYSAKSSYNFTDLSPASWQGLVERLQKDKELFNKFYKHYYSGSILRPPCDPVCRHRLICNLVSARSHSTEDMCAGVSVDRTELEEEVQRRNLFSGWWNVD